QERVRRRICTMHRLALILLIYPMAVPADTFELSDPAAEIFDQKQNQPEQQEPASEPYLVEEIFCAVDEKEGKCWCVHKETAKVVTIEHEECVNLASDISRSDP
ncbi:MAG: hypothetical protein OET41_15640, partial [Xanthomonadales bacterium]|nr:hypothetical protein [Xanthomonadales bacterium]